MKLLNESAITYSPSNGTNLEGKSQVGQAVVLLERGLKSLERRGAVDLLGALGQRRGDGIKEVRHRGVRGKSVSNNLTTQKHIL